MLPLNIRVNRNCQPIGTPQNAIPDVQELISLGGGHYGPPPCKVGLIIQLSTNILDAANDALNSMKIIIHFIHKIMEAVFFSKVLL